MRDKLGVCQWFHYEAYEDVERAVDLLRELGITHLRTGISWADWHRPGGPAWYDWQMKQLEEFEVLLSIWHTPPSIAEGSICAGPPRRLEEFGEFCGQMIDRHGHQFADLELWNEPNNRLKWAFDRFDPRWEKLGFMIRHAAAVSRARGKRNVLGGMIPVDHHWLELMKSHGALEDVDVVAIHAFPGMWWDDAPNWDWYTHWGGWADKIAYIAPHADGRPVWCTETGLATCEVKTGTPARRRAQVERLLEAAAAPIERQYWYCLVDLHPARDAIEGFHVDENEYHLGLVTYDGEKKESFHVMKDLLRGRPLGSFA
jgi:CDP-paratose 2-epimerase